MKGLCVFAAELLDEIWISSSSRIRLPAGPVGESTTSSLRFACIRSVARVVSKACRSSGTGAGPSPLCIVWCQILPCALVRDERDRALSSGCQPVCQVCQRVLHCSMSSAVQRATGEIG